MKSLMAMLMAVLSVSAFTVFTILLVITTLANADVYVRGYSRSNGTYVQPHYRSDPDGIRSNNWSYRGNVNPHTGEIGTSNYSSESFTSSQGSETLPYIPAQISLPNRPSLMPNPLPNPTLPSGGYAGASPLSY